MSIPPLPNVAGASLSGTKPYIITTEENRALCQSVGVEPAADGSAHPVYFYIAPQVGMGQTVAGICEICDFDVNVGPMMGTCNVTFDQPLKTEQPYMVTGEILGIQRKQSRKLGTMDIVEYQLKLSTPDGAPVLTNTNTWILPRGSEA